MPKRVAMVKPVPVGAHGDAPTVGAAVQLALMLQHLGNNRAYTVISHEGNVFTVHFEGDYAPTVLIFEGEKP
jgi:hypothetical protein